MLYLFGAFTHVFELNYDTDFNYPLKRNIVQCVDALAAQKPLRNCNIINGYNYSFVINNEKKCVQADNSSVRLVLVIKSAIDNFNRRLAIRNSWGYEERFFDVGVKRIFILGVTRNRTALREISNEQEEFGDIVQADFLDTYYNNTIKTMMAFKWAVEYCDAKFYLFSDDDMYISVKNILRFVRNPTEYPQYLERAKDNEVSKHLNKVTDYDLPEGVKFISGFVQFSAPHRHQCSKCYLPSAISLLVNVRELDVSKNYIREIDNAIKGCKKLASLNLSSNPLGRLTDGITQLISLEELYVNSIKADFLPANIGRLTKLKVLEVRDNNLNTLPKTISRLTSLLRLDIGENCFQMIPEELKYATKLQELWCDLNEIEVIPSFVSNFTDLVYLDVSENLAGA
ncbi:Beta-1,3-galactosyltransferase 1, partial [Sarracenia purpurea var. burkii]